MKGENEEKLIEDVSVYLQIRVDRVRGSLSGIRRQRRNIKTETKKRGVHG